MRNKRIRHLSLSILIMGISLSSGCQTPTTNFDCKYGKGVGCRPITEVNEMVNKGEINPKSLSLNPIIRIAPAMVNAENINSTTPMGIQRVTEEHLRVWLAPFQDEQGQFHEASTIHTVLRPGFWQWQGGL